MIGYANIKEAVSLPGVGALRSGRTETWTLKQLLRKIPTQKVVGDKNVEITGITCNSRQVAPGSLFVALRGTLADGHQFIEEAIDRGAVAVISERPCKGFMQVTTVQVEDAVTTLAEVLKRFYDDPAAALDIIQVTGTNGKTSVTMLIQYLLEQLGKPTGLLGSIHYDLGKRKLPSNLTTPPLVDLYDMLAQMGEAGCQAVVMEASSHGLAQRRLLGVDPKVAVFLNLSPEHMDFHSDMEDYYQTKRKLFECPLGTAPEVAVINLDNVYGQRLSEELPKALRQVTFAIEEDATLKAEALALGERESTFTLVYPEGELAVRVPLVGRFNVSNVLAALSVLYALGYDLAECAGFLEAFPGIPGRLERVDAGQGYAVWVDHAHKEEALHSVLGAIRPLVTGRILVVFGCGGNRDTKKRPRMAAVAEALADHVWITADNPRKEALADIFKDMEKGLSGSGDVRFVEDRKEAIRQAIAKARPGDGVLIAGKGHETFQEFAHAVVPFNDCTVAEALIKETN